MLKKEILYFQGPLRILTRTSKSQGVIKSIPREWKKKSGTSGNEEWGTPRAIPRLSAYFGCLHNRRSLWTACHGFNFLTSCIMTNRVIMVSVLHDVVIFPVQFFILKFKLYFDRHFWFSLFQCTLRSQIEGYTRLLIFMKFSTLSAVIWASPFINF